MECQMAFRDNLFVLYFYMDLGLGLIFTKQMYQLSNFRKKRKLGDLRFRRRLPREKHEP